MNLIEKNEILKDEAIKRKIEYNNNPHRCKYCNCPILMKNTDKYNDIYRKVFCSRSCASKYGHIVSQKEHITKQSRIELEYTDEELLSFFNTSNTVKELELKIGFSNILSQPKIINKFLLLGCNIDDLRVKKFDIKHMIKKDLFSEKSSWQGARSAIQKDARQTYKCSNKPKKCIICGYEKHFEVAHIKAVSDFNDDTLIEEINDIDNLIALCPNHHWEYDNNGLDILKYIV